MSGMSFGVALRMDTKRHYMKKVGIYANLFLTNIGSIANIIGVWVGGGLM